MGGRSHFKASYYVRHTALPRPGDEEELKSVAGRVFSQVLDRGRPLWELWLVEGLTEGRFAVLSKTHHALVDGISGVDLATVLFDSSATPHRSSHPSTSGCPGRCPQALSCSPTRCSSAPRFPASSSMGSERRCAGRGLVLERAGRALAGLGAVARSGMQAAPVSPFNVAIGPHRRFTWVSRDLASFQAVKDRFGGTVYDVVLTAVAGALGRYMRLHGQRTDDVVLRAMVPVSVRVDEERGTLGNRLAAM